MTLTTIVADIKALLLTDTLIEHYMYTIRLGVIATRERTPVLDRCKQLEECTRPNQYSCSQLPKIGAKAMIKVRALAL